MCHALMHELLCLFAFDNDCLSHSQLANGVSLHHPMPTGKEESCSSVCSVFGNSSRTLSP